MLLAKNPKARLRAVAISEPAKTPKRVVMAPKKAPLQWAAARAAGVSKMIQWEVVTAVRWAKVGLEIRMILGETKAATAAREVLIPKEALWAGIAKATATKVAMALSGVSQEAALMRRSKDLSAVACKVPTKEILTAIKTTGETKAGRTVGRTRMRIEDSLIK